MTHAARPVVSDGARAKPALLKSAPPSRRLGEVSHVTEEEANAMDP
jgi:hypothetical protein